MQEKLTLSIYGMQVVVDVDNDQVRRNIEKDFDHFIKNVNYFHKLYVKTMRKESLREVIPHGLVATKQSERAITYESKGIRYNDFYGEAISVINYKEDDISLYYKNEKILYETLYLLILSRSGKFMDRKGFHKLHACGVSMGNKNLLFMMPSKGGKTSTFLNLIRDKSVNIISDDTPVIDRMGKVHAFPLRIGLESKKEIINNFPYIKDEDVYEFERKYYSQKYLLNVTKLKNGVFTGNKNYLVAGFRSTNTEPYLLKVNKLIMLGQLKKHMIVGVGLPMILEYFLEGTLRDHIVNVKILASRAIAATRLILKSDCYFFYTSKNISKNAKVLKGLIE